MIGTRFARMAFWATAGLAAFFTLSPIADRPVTGFPANDERFAAFLLVGLLCSAAYPRGRPVWAVAIVAAAAVLEALQHATATRHGMPVDFVVKSAAGCLGVLAGACVDVVLAKVRTAR